MLLLFLLGEECDVSRSLPGEEGERGVKAGKRQAAVRGTSVMRLLLQQEPGLALVSYSCILLEEFSKPHVHLNYKQYSGHSC